MTKKWTLNIDIFLKRQEALIIEAINEVLEYIKKKIDEKTPENTKNLLENTKIVRARKVGNTIIGSVENGTLYAIYVEYGRSKEEGVPKLWVKFRYNKPKGSIFYEGVGARMFSRTADEERGYIINFIKRRVWGR